MDNNSHTFILMTDFESDLREVSYYQDMLFVDVMRVLKGEENYVDFLENLPTASLELFLDKINEKIRYLKNGKFVVFLLTLDKNYEFGS